MRVCRKIGKVTLAGTILTMGKSFSRAGPAMSASTGSCSGHHTLFDFAVKDWKGSFIFFFFFFRLRFFAHSRGGG